MTTWVLKGRESERNFLAVDIEGTARFISKATDAKRFQSFDCAQEFANKLSRREKITMWNEKEIQLLSIRVDEPSFIVDAWERVFKFLGDIILFSIVSRIIMPNIRMEKYAKSYVFVEIWILIWGLLSIAFLILATSVHQHTVISYFLLFLGAARVFEIIVYQINVTFLAEYRSLKNPNAPPYAVRGFRRLLVLLIHNYFEILLWFAGFYAYAYSDFASGEMLREAFGALYHSVITMSTLGYGNIHPVSGGTVGILLSCIQTLIGIFLALIVFARIVALIPRPLTMDEFER